MLFLPCLAGLHSPVVPALFGYWEVVVFCGNFVTVSVRIGANDGYSEWRHTSMERSDWKGIGTWGVCAL